MAKTKFIYTLARRNSTARPVMYTNLMLLCRKNHIEHYYMRFYRALLKAEKYNIGKFTVRREVLTEGAGNMVYHRNKNQVLIKTL